VQRIVTSPQSPCLFVACITLLPSLLAQLPATVGPRFNEVSRDWGKWFVILRFFSIYYTITGLKNIVCYAKDFVIIIEVCHLNARSRQKCGTCGIRVAFGSILSLMWYQVILKIP